MIMNILLTNDDGYQSCGLQTLCRELAAVGHNVWVVAPDGQRSGFSHAMNYNKPLELAPIEDLCGAKQAFCCSGTPADCVRIALLHLGVKFDLLIAGPNNAANFGRALLCSGTVGAAEEGALCGVRSIALSRLEHCDYYEAAVGYLTDNLATLTEAIQPNMFLNINVPNLPLQQIKGVKVCPQSVKQPSFEDCCEALDEHTVKIIGKRNPLTEEYSDVYLSVQGYITITPMTVSRTDVAQLERLARLEK